MRRTQINIVYESIIKELGSEGTVEKCLEFFRRPKNKWGNEPLDKATLELLKNEHFLAVKHLSGITDKFLLNFLYLS